MGREAVTKMFALGCSLSQQCWHLCVGTLGEWMPQAGGPGPGLSSVPCCPCPGLLGSFVTAVHWKGTASGSAVGFLFVFLMFSYVADTGSQCLPIKSLHVLP